MVLAQQLGPHEEFRYLSTHGSRRQIMIPLLPAHCIPLRRSLLVCPHIEELGANHQDYIIASDGDENLVASEIVRRIIGSVDVDADNIACLDTLRH